MKESIINAYEIRTGLSRTKISNMMDATTWMNANKAIELGFADDILTDEKLNADVPAFVFSDSAVERTLINKLTAKAMPLPQDNPKETPEQVIPKTEAHVTEKITIPQGRRVDDLKARLMTIKNYM